MITPQAVLAVLQQNPDGIEHPRLQRKFGITDPHEQQQRADVWKLSGVLAGLVRERFAATRNEAGRRVHYPRHTI